MTVELIYDQDCPNADAARDVLRRALTAEGLEPVWTEWDREASDAPEYARAFGSPTILVDGRDVAGDAEAADANCCRVYPTDEGLRGVPALDDVRAALRRSLAAAG